MAPTMALPSPGFGCVRNEWTDQGCTSSLLWVKAAEQRPPAATKAWGKVVHFRAAILIPNCVWEGL